MCQDSSIRGGGSRVVRLSPQGSSSTIQGLSPLPCIGGAFLCSGRERHSAAARLVAGFGWQVVPAGAALVSSTATAPASVTAAQTPSEDVSGPCSCARSGGRANGVFVSLVFSVGGAISSETDGRTTNGWIGWVIFVVGCLVSVGAGGWLVWFLSLRKPK